MNDDTSTSMPVTERMQLDEKFKRKDIQSDENELCEEETSSCPVPATVSEASMKGGGFCLDPPDGPEVSANIAMHLKPHQKDGIKFMWKSCAVENNGCILAHSMGLGKTIQIVALVHTFTSENVASDKSAKCIILTPCSLVANWKDEFAKWISPTDKFLCRTITNAIKVADRIKVLKEWTESTTPSCLITSYETFCNLSEHKEKALEMAAMLFDGPDLAIFDEGHRLKNDKSRVGKILRKLKTTRQEMLCWVYIVQCNRM